jgi:uncharacterized protein (TIGR04255 family)
MGEADLSLSKPPIVEAVLDIECDMPAGYDVAQLEDPARDAYRDRYPTLRKQWIQEHRIEAKLGESPTTSMKRVAQALQFRAEDEKQLVQVRIQGFSFNRLAPYTRLDDYLPEIERTWKLFVTLASPVEVKLVRLRYINRILLPMSGENVELDDYLRTGPRLFDEEAFMFHGFLNQHAVQEIATGHRVNTVLMSQPIEGDDLPLIFDIAVSASGPAEPGDWPWIVGKLGSLRTLKNLVFRKTLTEQCLNLFQQ